MKVNITFSHASYDVECEAGGRVSLTAILAKFTRKLNATLSYPRAVLTDHDDATNVIQQDDDKYFACRPNGCYTLHLGLVAPTTKRLSDGALRTSTVALQKSATASHSSFASEVDIEIASILSRLVYSDNPLKQINTDFDNDRSMALDELKGQDCGLKFAEHASHPYLMAVTKRCIGDMASKEGISTETTLWIAFRGTMSWKDLLTDLRLSQTLSVTGSIHTGFFHRARAMPQTFFEDEFKFGKYHRMIFTGHSLGGAVAHVCAIQLLCRPSNVPHANKLIYSIALGAPFVGDAKLAESLRTHPHHLNKHFLTIMNESDAVPGILNFCLTAVKLRRTVESCQQLLQGLANIAKPLVMLNVPFLPGAISFIETLRSLMQVINFVLPKLDALLKKSGPIYIPFGIYAFLKPASDKKLTYIENAITDQDVIMEYMVQIMNDQKRYEWSNYSNHKIENYQTNILCCSAVSRRVGSMSDNDINIHELTVNCTPRIYSATITVDEKGPHMNVALKGMALTCIHSPLNNRWTTLDIVSASSSKSEQPAPKKYYHKLNASVQEILPPHARITVGPHYVLVKTDFGIIHHPLQPCDIVLKGTADSYTSESKLDANMLYMALLRAHFAFLHDGSRKSDSDVETTNSCLMIFHRLIRELDSPPASKKFIEHIKGFQYEPLTGEVCIDDKFHEVMPRLLRSVYKSLVAQAEYEIPRSYLQSAFLVLSGLVAAVITVTPLGIAVGAAMIIGGVAVAAKSYHSRYSDVKTWAYQEHLQLVAASVGVDILNCTDEHMLEHEVQKVLDSAKVPDVIDDDVSADKLKQLFSYKSTKVMPTLKDTYDCYKRKALKFARHATLVHVLRRTITARIYIAFVAVRPLSKCILSALWAIPVTLSEVNRVECYALSANTSRQELHVLVCPKLENIHETLAKLHRYYTIQPVFCVVAGGSQDVEQIANFRRDSISSRASTRGLSNESSTKLHSASVRSPSSRALKTTPQLKILSVTARRPDGNFTMPNSGRNREGKFVSSRIITFLDGHLQLATNDHLSITDYQFERWTSSLLSESVSSPNCLK